MFKIILLKIKICSLISIIIMSANFNQNKFSLNLNRIFFRVSTQTAITLSSIIFKMAKRFASHTPSEIIEKNLNVVQTILWKGINKSQSSEGLKEKKIKTLISPLLRISIKRSTMSLQLGLETDRELCKSSSLEIQCKD